MIRLPVSIFLALRYLRPRRSFVSVITVISVLGVMLGVMVLIVVISVMAGFHHELRQKVVGLDSHLTITSSGTMRDWEETAAMVQKRPHVRGVAPFIIVPVLIKFQGRAFPVYVKGISLIHENRVSNLKYYLTKGTLDLEGDRILVGIELTRQFGIFVGDKVNIYSPKNVEDPKVTYLPVEATVSGVFNSGMFQYDRGIYCSLETAQDLYDLGSRVHGLAVVTDDLESVDRVQKDFENILRPPMRARTWMELNRQLFEVIAVEKNIMFFLFIFIIIVAAFGIMSTLITVTVQKTREIGILKSLGATPWDILVIFLTQGVVVGTLGISLGLTLGLIILHYRNEFLEFLRAHSGFELFPREIYNFSQLPAQTNPKDALIICAVAFLICVLAGLFPAWRAARLQPARALRDF